MSIAALGALAISLGFAPQVGQSPRKLVTQSALAQAPACESLGGLNIDPIASAVPGTMFLESEGWRISNTDSEPLVINSVVINGERAAPLGAASNGHVRRADELKYPVTVRTGESLAIFGYALGDARSYEKQVNYLTLDTNRGKFRYGPSAGIELQ